MPAKQIATLCSLKLLDVVVRLTTLATSSGHRLSKDGAVLWDRLLDDAPVPAQPIAHLFALYDLRILGAHRAEDGRKRLQAELDRFDIAPGELAAGCGSYS